MLSHPPVCNRRAKLSQLTRLYRMFNKAEVMLDGVKRRLRCHF